MAEICCIIPSYKRSNSLIECVESYMKHTQTKSLVVIVDDSPEEERSSVATFASLVEKYPQHQVEVITTGGKNGVGAARNFGIDYCMNHPDYNFKAFFNFEDDARILGNATDNIWNVMSQDERFGYVGTIGNYVMWNHEFTEKSIRWMTNIGIYWAFSRGFLKDCGNFDLNLRLREDVEMGLRAWSNGYWVAAVHAPVFHKRSGSDFKAGEAPWMEACDYIQKKYGSQNVTVTRKGSIRRRKSLSYPEFGYSLDASGKLVKHDSYKSMISEELKIHNHKKAIAKAQKESVESQDA